MTAYTDFITQVKDWANREDWSDALAAGFVRMGEERLNQDLRIDWMIQHDTGNVIDREVSLPTDWLQAHLIRRPDGRPIRYKSQDEFYNLVDDRASGYYTINGRNLVLGGAPELTGQIITLDYYGKIPPMTTTSTWLYDNYQTLYLNAVMIYASAFGVEDERAMGFESQVAKMIEQLNETHLKSKSSGSRVTRTRTRSFG
jgi:hypothetical protein